MHTDLAGNPRKIVGCGSNEVGKYTTAVVDLYSMGYFAVMDDSKDLPSKMAGSATIHKDFLKETSFPKKSVGASLMPNWVIFYFGEDLTYGTLLGDDVKDSFAA